MPPLPTWLVLAMLVVPTGLPAQSRAPRTLDPNKPLTQFSIDLWTEGDGLPQNMAGAIAQTPDGYLWIGMEEGLVRFDGATFRVFDPSNTPALSTPWVTALWADADGTLWIGTGGGGLLRLREGGFTRYGIEDGLPHNHVRSIFRDRGGVLWIGTGGGAARLVDGRFDALTSADGLSSDVVLAIAQDSAGAVWLGTVDGLNRVDDDGIRVFHTADGLAGEQIPALVVGRDGSLWIGTTDGGLSRYRDGRFTTYSAAAGLSSDFVTSLYEDSAGALWIGTNGGGVNRLHDGRITSLTVDGGLPSNLVLSLRGDREGNLWMGLTGAGLGRLRDGMVATLGRPEGLSAEIALAVLEDRAGDVWIGTAGGGLDHLHRDGRITSYTTADGLAHNIVIALAEARNGDLWVGMAAGGISRIRDGAVRTFDRGDGLASTRVVDIVEDRDGRLWLATLGAGVQHWSPDGGGSRVYTRADGLPDDYATALLEAGDGGLWVGTRSGLARIVDGRISAIDVADAGQPGSHVTSLYEDAEGSLWVVTDAGLARVHDGRVTRYDRADGLFDRELHAVVEDTAGYLWLSSNHGIARIRKADFDALDDGRIDRVHADVFGVADGMRSPEANGGINPAGIRRSDGTLWFPTMKGVAVVDPGSVIVGRPLPDPILEHVAVADGDHAATAPLVLPPGSRSLEFHFTAPTFTAPDELRFRYRLEGFDDDWVNAGDRRVAYYTNVPPGAYRFRVGVRRGDGEWSVAEAGVDLVLEPHFYETPAFLALCILGVVGLGLGGYRLRIRSLTKRQGELMRVVAERERTERALRRSEERLRLALEAGRMGAWEWDLATDAITVSATTRTLFGFSPSTPAEARAQLEAVAAAEDVARLADLPLLVAEGRDEFDLRFPIVRDDGERQHIELRGRVFVDAAGAAVRVAGVVADVTEFMNAQEALRRREEELRQAQKMEAVGRLAGGVAHDFNNLLTTITGRIHLVLDALGPDDALREDVEEVRDAAQRAANLTKQLLTFSRKQVFQPRLIDLNELIEGVERMLRRLVREDVVLETRLDPGIGRIRADPGGIEQVLLNLVVNAQDAMPDGGRILIETRNARPGDACAGSGDEDGGCLAVLSVSDTGHGMSEETQKQAFEPFFTTKPVGKGTGLGLATVYGVVQQCGGRIRMESRLGHGTRFDVYLPCVRRPEPRPERARPETGAHDGSETILLVEDEPAVRTLARKILERRGYIVLDAASGAEALEICRGYERPIHLLVSDVVMPEIGGRELAEEVRRLRPGIQVLLMSGYNEDEVLRRGVPDSGMAFLQKPFEPEGFARRIREVLDVDEQVHPASALPAAPR